MTECAHGLDTRWCDVCAHGATPRPSATEKAPPAACRSCGAEIVWCLTEMGRKMPVDYEPTDDGNVMKLWDDASGNHVIRVMRPDDEWPAGRKRYVAHFRTCPNADEWRKVRGRTGKERSGHR